MTHNPSGVPSWSLADRLRKVRRDRHLTQEQMAAALGVKAVTWSSWESGRTRPHDVVGLASSIELTFGVPAAWVLGVLTSPPSQTGEIPLQRSSGLPPVPPTPRRNRTWGRRWDDGVMSRAVAIL